MALKTFVKISNISNLSDARYCAGMMVDVLGFNIDSASENYISQSDFEEITEWVAGVKFAGEFYQADLNKIKEAIKRYHIDYIEISDMNLVEGVNLLGKPIIFRLHIPNVDQLKKLAADLSYLDELVEMVIIDSDNETLFDQLDAQMGYYNGNLHLIKGYGIQAQKDLSKFPGLEMKATHEERPGYKDYGQIMDVLESIESD